MRQNTSNHMAHSSGKCTICEKSCLLLTIQIISHCDEKSALYTLVFMLIFYDHAMYLLCTVCGQGQTEAHAIADGLRMSLQFNCQSFENLKSFFQI